MPFLVGHFNILASIFAMFFKKFCKFCDYAKKAAPAKKPAAKKAEPKKAEPKAEKKEKVENPCIKCIW